MKIATDLRDLESNLDPNKSRKFSIDMNAKAFQVLSSNIYSDKPRAIVRELACNALDEHLKHKIAKPFRIAAPSSSNPHFVIRDYARGLSDDDVQILYTTFFRSTKGDNNDAIGGLGLGSKSPLAYTDMFTVRSIQNKRSRSFIIFKNKQGVPEITPGEITTVDEEDGLEVLVPIKREDYSTFIAAMQKVLIHFPKGSYTAFGAGIGEKTFTMDKGSWAANGGHTTVALMGPVAYKIDWNVVFGRDYSYQKHPSEGLEFRFNIGDLDIAPSREALSYDKHTIEKLKLAYAKMRKDVADEIEQREKVAKSEWDLAFVRRKIAVDLSAVWSLTELPSDYGALEIKSKGGFTFRYAPKQELNKKTTKIDEQKVVKFSGPNRYDSTGREFRLVWDTGENRMPSRIKRHYEENRSRFEYLIFDATKWKSRDECSLDLGGAPDDVWLNLAELPVPDPVARQLAAPTGDAILFQLNKNYNSWSDRSRWMKCLWREVENETATIVYVEMKGAICERADFDAITASPIATKGPKIFGLPKRILTECALPKNFIAWDDYVKKIVDQIVTTKTDTPKFLLREQEIADLISELPYWRSVISNKEYFKDVAVMQPFLKALVALNDFKPALVASMYEQDVLRVHGNGQAFTTLTGPNLLALANTVRQDRPLFQLVERLFSSIDENEWKIVLSTLET